jgi:hypothetical protein
MFRRGVTAVGWGVVGVALSAALIAGAFAVAGARLTEPAMPIRVSAPPLIADRSSERDPGATETRSPDEPAATASVAVADEGPVAASTMPADDRGARDTSGRDAAGGDD